MMTTTDAKPSDLDGQAKLPGTDATPADTATKAPTDKAPKATRTRKSAAARAAEAPPSRRKSTAKGGRPSRAQFDATCAELVDRLIGLLTIAGIASPTIAYDAAVLDGKRDELVKELSERCWSNDRLRAFVLGAADAGEWARTFSLILGIGVPIAANHGLLPPASAVLIGAPLPPERKRKPDVSEPVAEGDPIITERFGSWPFAVPDAGDG